MVTWSNVDDIASTYTTNHDVTASFVANVAGEQTLPTNSLALVGTYDPVRDIVIPGTRAGINRVSNPQDVVQPKVS